MSNASASEELYYSVEYKNTATFNKLVKKKSLNVVYNIPELHVAQIKMTKMHANALANYKMILNISMPHVQLVLLARKQ